MWCWIALVLAGEPEPSNEPRESSAEEQVEEAPPPPDPLRVNPGMASETLENGLRVSIVADPAHPIVATQTWVHVGGAHEQERERGFAHLFEHLMFGETEQHEKGHYDRLHARRGGYENAYTSWDETVYLSQIEPSSHDEVLTLEALRLSELVLSQSNLDNEKKIVAEELRLRMENDPTGKIASTFLAGLFGDHPYAVTPAGTHEDIEGADLELAQKFYGRYYRPENVHLVIVGPVDVERTLERVRETHGALPIGNGVLPAVPTLEGWDFPRELDLGGDIPPVRIFGEVYPVPPLAHPDTLAIEVMLEMLNGSQVDRFREILVTERRQALEGLTLDLRQKHGGVVGFVAVNLFTRSKRRGFKNVGSALEKLKEETWLTESALASAIRALRLRDALVVYSADERASAIGTALHHYGDEALAFERVDRLREVGIEEVRRVFRTYIADVEPIRGLLRRRGER